MIEENYIPYYLLLKGYRNCTIWEKIEWMFYQFRHDLEEIIKPS